MARNERRSDEFRRRVLEDNARSTQNFVGRDIRPDLLGKAMAFKPDFSRTGEVDSEAYNNRTGGRTPVRPFIGSAIAVTRGADSGAAYDNTASGNSGNVWFGYTRLTGTLTISSAVVTGIDDISATDPPLVGDTVTLVGGSIMGNILAIDLTLHTITLDAASVINFSGYLLSKNTTGPIHPYPESVNGFYQFGYNMGAIFRGQQGGDSGAAPATEDRTGTLLVQVLDAGAGVLTSASCVFTHHGDSTGDVIDSIDSNAAVFDTTQITGVYGCKLTITRAPNTVATIFVPHWYIVFNIINPYVLRTTL